MCWLHYGILLAISSSVLNTSVSDMVYIHVSISYLYEIINTAAQTILDIKFISTNAVMDLLYIIWMSQWPFYAWAHFNRVYDTILFSTSSSITYCKNNSHYIWCNTTIYGCVLQSYSRHAFFKSSTVWHNAWFLLSYCILYVHVKDNFGNMLKDMQ